MDRVVSDQDDVRQIVNNGMPTRFARGWYCMGLAKNFRQSPNRSLKAFGQKLRFSTAPDDQLQVRNELCPLTLKDSKFTPFCGVHGTGHQTPVEPTSCWPILEQDGLLFLWNDSEGNPPLKEQPVPRIHGADSAEWTEWVWHENVVAAEPRDVVEHIVNTASFIYAQGERPTFFKNVFEDHVATQYFEGPMRTAYTRLHVHDEASQVAWTNSAASYFGPSFMIDELEYVYDDYDLNAVLINAHYPIDENSLVLLSGVSVKKNAVLAADPQDFAADQASRILHGFSQDVEIWQKKTRIDNPLLCEEDGPVYQLRRWYEQFFTDVADIEAPLTDRFEYELDVTMPQDTWQRSLAKNLNSRKPIGKQPV